MVKFSPSLLASDFTNLENEISKVEKADYLHLDVMDGNFVPNITFGPGLINSIRDKTSLKFDTHLMISNPEKYISKFADAGSDLITIHAEASKHVHRVIQLIKNQNCRAGIALNPATPLNELKYILPEVDLVLIMSVNPGFGGQKFIPQIIQKIERLSEMAVNMQNSVEIAVDGGINKNNIKDVVNAGANMIIAGSAIFKQPNPEKALIDLKARINN